MSTKFNILTFNGGGVRGIISSTFIDRLSTQLPTFIENTNMLGGTSTGAIIAAGLAYKISPNKIKELYSEENSKYIFSPAYSYILRPKYSSTKLLELLKKTFPDDLRLKDLDKIIIIPSFSLGDSTTDPAPIFYSNIEGSKTRDAKVIDVLMATCAAPTYFPSYQKQIDGGIVAYDPSLVCLLYALSIAKDMLPKINLLSMATGSSKIKRGFTEDTTTWGATQWMLDPTSMDIPMLKISTISNATISYFATSRILNEKYHRLNLEYDDYIKLDDYNEVSYLENLARDKDISATISWIENNWL